jgi:hypothetical protein
VLPIFCGTTELVKDLKVVNFGLNLITQFRTKQVFILPIPLFVASLKKKYKGQILIFIGL